MTQNHIVIDDALIQVKDLKLSMSKAKIMKIMGNPSDIKKSEWETEMGMYNEEILTYSNIIIRMLNNECSVIRVKDNSVTTTKGAKIGDSYDMIKSLYGEPDFTDSAYGDSGFGDPNNCRSIMYGYTTNYFYLMIDSDGAGNVLEMGLMRDGLD